MGDFIDVDEWEEERLPPRSGRRRPPPKKAAISSTSNAPQKRSGGGGTRRQRTPAGATDGEEEDEGEGHGQATPPRRNRLRGGEAMTTSTANGNGPRLATSGDDYESVPKRTTNSDVSLWLSLLLFHALQHIFLNSIMFIYLF